MSLVRFVVCVAALSQVACFLTTELGLPAYDAVPGTEVRERLAAAASVGFTVGRSAYEREKGLGRQPDGGDLVNAWETGVMAPALAGVQDDSFYVLKTVKDCEETMLLYSIYYAYSLSLESFGESNPTPGEAVNGGTAAFAAGNCNLLKTGRWISVNERLNF